MKTHKRMLPIAMVSAGLALATGAQVAMAAQPQPFKLTNVHLETNASACDMGIQIVFDTDGITECELPLPRLDGFLSRTLFAVYIHTEFFV